jgi:hypothetical protein
MLPRTTQFFSWARSKDHDAADRAEKSSSDGRSSRRWKSRETKRNQLTLYINVLAKSNDPLASERAMETLNQMKKLGEQDGREDCWPDVFT